MTLRELLDSYDRIKNQGRRKVDRTLFQLKENCVDQFAGDISFMLWRIYDDDTFIVMDDHYHMDEPLQEEGSLHSHRTEYHNQDFIEIGYVYSGQFKQNIVGKDYVYNEGDVFLIDQHTMRYDYIKNCDTTVFFLKFSPTYIDDFFIDQLEDGEIKSLLRDIIKGEKRIHQFIKCSPLGPAKPITDIVDNFIEELTYRRAGWSYITKGLLSRYITAITTLYTCHLYQFNLKKMDTLVYDQLIQYIENHFATVTTEDLVTKFHYNGSYYNRLIKKYSGLTYKQYVQRVRLEHAKLLLLQTSLPVNTISQDCGYVNKGYFYRIFKDSENSTPQEYREKYTRNTIN